jgi:hypothetical protein
MIFDLIPLFLAVQAILTELEIADEWEARFLRSMFLPSTWTLPTEDEGPEDFVSLRTLFPPGNPKLCFFLSYIFSLLLLQDT